MILRASDRAAVPWKNGGGVTREIAVHPAGATMDDFVWRISMATVASARPFSNFTGIDPVLVVLEGVLSLETAGRHVSLGTDSAPFALAGDVATYGEPLGGPVTDLNVMPRRGWFRAGVRLASGAVRVPGETVLVVARQAAAVAGVRLNRHDVLRLDGRGGDPLDLGVEPVLLIDISSDEGRPAS